MYKKSREVLFIRGILNVNFSLILSAIQAVF